MTPTASNLERATCETMGGLRGEPIAHDSAYIFPTLLTFLSVLLFIPLLICCIRLVVWAQTQDERCRVASGD